MTFFRKTILTAASCLSLISCGGSPSDSVINVAASDVVTTPMPLNTEGFRIVKPATAYDGYSGGLSVTRDTKNQAGGTRGYVNTASLTHSLVGSEMIQFEWANLSILDNYSKYGENVATYSQANKFAPGPTWAAVSEATDTVGAGGALVAHEFDLFTTGSDDGNRIGLDIVSGDGRFVRNLGKSDRADATAAIRIGQSSATPWATWGTGVEIGGNIRDSALVIKNSSGQIVFEIKPNGDMYQRGQLIR